MVKGHKSLLSVTDSSRLADNRDLNLTRIGHFGLNLLREVVCDAVGVLVAHLVGTYDDTQLTTCHCLIKT